MKQMQPLRISIVGLSRWESVFVETTVSLASGIDIAPWHLVDEPDDADVLLVDADRSSYMFLNQTNDEPSGGKMPIVVSFSANPEACEQIPARCITRPVRHADLISVLQEIEHELQDNGIADETRAVEPETAKERRPEESAPENSLAEEEPAEDGGRELPRVVAEPAARTELPSIVSTSIEAAPERPAAQPPSEVMSRKTRPARRFVEATRFIGLVRQVLRRGRPVEITHPVYPDVRIFPQLHAYSSTDEPTSIPAMFRESATLFTVSELADDTLAETYAASQFRPLSRLIYCAALFGSEGRLVLNCSVDDKLRLVDWPDFDMLPHVPEHRQIARFMLENDANLTEIATALDVRLGLVISFCNACEAAGLIRRIPASVPDRISTLSDAEGTGTHLLDRVRGLFKPQGV